MASHGNMPVFGDPDDNIPYWSYVYALGRRNGTTAHVHNHGEPSTSISNGYPKAEEAIKSITFSAESINPQWESPLFSRLPPEIRGLIFEYALKDYEDKTKVYKDTTCYKRPEYLAPRRTDTELLRTCKRIYTEAWYLPWARGEHAFYLAWDSRKPSRTATVKKMQKSLNAMHASHVELSIDHVRVFAQLCQLEGVMALTEILDMKYFHPKVITITVRHTDWWEWEQDRPLHFGEEWVNICKFPESMKALRVTFESLERKKASVDQVVEQAIENWEFERKDGVIMSAEGCVPSIMRWSGASTWEDRRWLRDETRPNRLDYYVSTVTWRPVVGTPANVLPDGVETEAPEPRKRKIAKPLDAVVESRLTTSMDSIWVAELKAAAVPEDVSADVVRVLVTEYREILSEGWSPFNTGPTNMYVGALGVFNLPPLNSVFFEGVGDYIDMEIPFENGPDI